FCTTVSYYPQLKKHRDTGSAGDLWLKMFLTLAVGGPSGRFTGSYSPTSSSSWPTPSALRSSWGSCWREIIGAMVWNSRLTNEFHTGAVRTNLFDSADEVQTIVDPKDAAESAGLRYV